MKNWKKAGLTALAGSLVAFSANAGSMSVSGSANLTYTGNTGQEDAASGANNTGQGNDGSRWGMARSLTFSGSGEMDNGWTVSVSQTIANGSTTAHGITLDMGDMGSVNYENSTGSRGIGKISDMMPTADEDAGNGLDTDGSAGNSGVSGKVSGGVKGFHYSKAMDMIEIGLGYAPKGGANVANGGTSGEGGGASAVGGFLKVDPVDGLEVGIGWGEKGNATAGQEGQTDDHSTYYATYVWGAFTVGAQIGEVDYYNTGNDDDNSAFGILYAVNDEMSISYQERVNDLGGTTVDEEISGWSAAYTMGSMTFKAHKNKGTGMDNTANSESEHTEIGVTFAF
jgi:outer membrane protein OmpU